jgi:hypothetical protein
VDDVFFDAASGAVTVTVSLTPAMCQNLDFTGFTGTLAGILALDVFGNFTASSAMTWSHTGSLLFDAATTGKTITTAGKTINSPVSFGASFAGGGWTLQDAFTTTGSLTINRGTFNTGGFTVTATTLSSSNANTRAVNLGSSTVILTGAAPISLATVTGLTFNAGTSQINCSGLSPTFSGGGQTFYNVTLMSTASTSVTITGANTFNNLTILGRTSTGVITATFDSPQVINGTLSTTGTAGNRRVWFRGLTYGLAQTLTINSAPSLTDADFRDIYVIGTAAPISGTRIGNRGACRGITFDTPKTVYWNLAGAQNWSADAWATTSTGAPSTDNFPLPQDTATFTDAGSVTGTITLDTAIAYVPSVDMAARTSAMTLSATNTTVYGNWANGSGTTITGLGGLTFSGGTTQTIASAGKAFAGSLNVDSYGGTVQLAGALNIGTSTLNVVNGTFTTQNYSVTAAALSSNNNNVRTINLGASTLTLSSTTPVGFTAATNLTFSAGLSQINCLSATPTFAGGGQTFYGVDFTSPTSGGVVAITGRNTFALLSADAPALSGIKQLTFSADQIISTLLAGIGGPTRRVFLRSDVLGTPRILTVGGMGGGLVDNCDFRDITIAGAAAGTAITSAGDCGGNSGITFPAPKTVYWNLGLSVSWSAVGWATSSGGSPAVNNFPLAQDTAIFDNTGSAGTVAINANWNIGTVNFSARTSAMALAINSGVAAGVYGDWLFGTGVTSTSGTGTTTFSGRGTQTITSNGVTFGGPITIDCYTGTVQLADALTIGSTRTLTVTSGAFDAVTYNVTTGLFTLTAGTLKMGSGTWTLSGTGAVWTYTAGTLFLGTANITLSDTSIAARTFAGGGLSYNKLTIGGTTGISTLTITGNNQFTELASTKTVAHTIALGATTQTFGKWSVSGTAGNVVTVSGTATITIAGARVSGVDYLALDTTTISATSPGEFYAGANSTGGTNAILTAAPAPVTRYWRGGTGTWDATTTTNWSATSGGAGGASVPTSADAVVFNSAANATAYTVTCTATQLRCASLTMAGPAAGNVTWAGTARIAMHDNVSLAATGVTRSYTGTIILSGANTGKTFTTNGVGLTSTIQINGVGCGWTLGSALLGSSTITITNGLFDTGNFSFVGTSLMSDTANTRTINLGSSTVTLSGSPALSFTPSTNITFNAGTSQINCSYSGLGFYGGGNTFYNVSFTSTIQTSAAITGANTFNNLTIAGRASAGINAVSIADDQTINGNLTLSAGTNATTRTFMQSDAIGTTRTLTCAAVASLTDIDFRDITIAGAAAPVSGTRLGDCKGNSGITFPAGTNKYWNLAGSNSWSATAWATSAGGAVAANNFPLAQDTAIFTSTVPASGTTTTLNTNWNIGTIDMSARVGPANAMALATGATTPSIYGNWINGTGTTLIGTGSLTFAGRGSQTITSAGRTFTQFFPINTPSGAVTLQDAFVCSALNTAFVLTQGTFDANSYNVTTTGTGSGAGMLSTGTGTRTIAVGSGTWSIAGAGSPWSVTATGLTITGTGTISLTSASAKTFAGGSISYSGITINQGGAGALTITGNNTFADITNSYSATGATNITLGTTTQTVTQFTATGTAGKVLTIQGSSAASPGTLIFTGANKPNVDYLAVTGVRAYSLDNTWYAGDNSTNNGSLGWYFEAGTVGPIAVYITESARPLDVQATTATLNPSLSESARPLDAQSARLVYIGTLSESATAADVAEAVKAYFAAVSEAATASDLLAASLTLSATIAELTTGADQLAVRSLLNVPVDETATTADSAAAQASVVSTTTESAQPADTTTNRYTARPTVAEATQLTDTITNQYTALPTVAEAAQLTDTPTARYTTNPTIAEVLSVSDRVVGGLLFLSHITEATTARDIAAAVLIFNRVVAEAASAAEVLAAVATFRAAVPESVTGSDVARALLTYGSAVSEALAAFESSTNRYAANPKIAEAAAVQEAETTRYTARPRIVENLAVQDLAAVVASTFKAGAAETARPLDTPQGANTGASRLSESAAASEANAAKFTAATRIAEQSNAQQTAAARFVAVTRVAEVAASADTASVAPSVFGAIARAAVQAVESFNPAGSVYHAALPIQGAGITDSLIGAYLWNDIDDSQIASWQNINNAQAASWTGVSDVQTPSWQNVNNTQTAGWTDVNDNQTPGWTPIEP